MTGGDLTSREQRNPAAAVGLRYVTDSWLLVIRLKGYIFFASVQKVTAHVRQLIREEQEISHYKRTKFILLDCALLDGMDSSAEKDIQSLGQEANGMGVCVIWSGLRPKSLKGLLTRKTIRTKKHHFPDVDAALLYVEVNSAHYRNHQQSLWNHIHPAFELFQYLSLQRAAFEPFAEVLRLDVERFGSPFKFCEAKKIKAFETVLWVPGEFGRELYLIHSGAVGLFTRLPSRDGKQKPVKPVCVYRHGWFLNREFIMQAPTRHFAVALEDGEVLSWNAHAWWRMHREAPVMASAITESSLRQSMADMNRLTKMLGFSSIYHTADERAMEETGHFDDTGQDHHGLRNWNNKETENATDFWHQILHDTEAEEDANMFAQRANEDAALTEIEPPDFLQLRLSYIETAEALERFGLFEPLPEGEDGILPPLSEIVLSDLETAFATFLAKSQNDADSMAIDGFAPAKANHLSLQYVNEALMYAGIFNVLIVESALPRFDDYLTWEEFRDLGHEAFFMRFSLKQVSIVLDVYKDWQENDPDGQVNRDDLIDIFRSTFMPTITEQEVNGISTVFDTDNSQSLEEPEFLAIVSRMVRRHEQDWNMLRGIRDILGKTEVRPEPTSSKNLNNDDVLAVDDLLLAADKMNNRFKIERSDAEEMLWCMACYSQKLRESDKGEILDFPGLVGAVSVAVEIIVRHDDLPPKPPNDCTPTEVARPSRRAPSKVSLRRSEKRGVSRSGTASSFADVVDQFKNERSGNRLKSMVSRGSRRSKRENKLKTQTQDFNAEGAGSRAL
jgi:CRP-like cAMP-binding protein